MRTVGLDKNVSSPWFHQGAVLSPTWLQGSSERHVSEDALWGDPPQLCNFPAVKTLATAFAVQSKKNWHATHLEYQLFKKLIAEIVVKFYDVLWCLHPVFFDTLEGGVQTSVSDVLSSMWGCQPQIVTRWDRSLNECEMVGPQTRFDQFRCAVRHLVGKREVCIIMVGLDRVLAVPEFGYCRVYNVILHYIWARLPVSQSPPPWYGPPGPCPGGGVRAFTTTSTIATTIITPTTPLRRLLLGPRAPHTTTTTNAAATTAAAAATAAATTTTTTIYYYILYMSNFISTSTSTSTFKPNYVCTHVCPHHRPQGGGGYLGGGGRGGPVKPGSYIHMYPLEFVQSAGFSRQNDDIVKVSGFSWYLEWQISRLAKVPAEAGSPGENAADRRFQCGEIGYSALKTCYSSGCQADVKQMSSRCAERW